MFKEQLELVPADEGHGPVICHATGEDQGADKGAPPGSRWAAGRHGIRGSQRAIGIDVDERVQLAVESLDALERRLGQLTGTELAGANERFAL